MSNYYSYFQICSCFFLLPTIQDIVQSQWFSKYTYVSLFRESVVFNVHVCFLVQSQWFSMYTYVSLFRELVAFKVHVCFLVQRVSGFQSTRMFPCSESRWFSKYTYISLFRESVVFKVHVCFLAQRVIGFSRYTYVSTTMVPLHVPPPPHPTVPPHPPTQPPPSLFVFFYSPLLCTVSPSVTRSGISYCPRCFGPKTVWCC